MSTNFLKITANLVGKPRFSVMEGRDYIVLPVTILVEGVHSGSNGPTLYLLEDLEKFAPAWNHKPVVVNHPKKGGEYVSADDPTILSTSKVGILMANKVVGKGQSAEAWLEKSRLKEVDSRILDAIDKGLVVEVSTGLFSDNEDTPGTWNGEEYNSIARSYRPDHLALLPDLVGACSVADGCGLFTASEAMEMEVAENVQFMLNDAMTNKKKWKKKGKMGTYEMSHDEVRSELADMIWSAAQETKTEEYTYHGYLIEVFDDYVIYCVGDTYYRQSYSKKEDAVELVGDPEEVTRTTAYTPVSNIGDNPMEKTECKCPKVKALVDSLISANRNWAETDREFLQGQPEQMLKKFVAMDTPAEPPKEEDDTPPAESKAANPPAEQVANTVPKPKKQTVEEYIKSVPKQYQEVLARGLSALNAERARLTDIILSNESNTFTKEELAGYEPAMLQKLAALAVKEEEEKTPQHVDLFNYVGGIGAPMSNVGHQEEHLPLPTMNFAKK